MLPRICNLDFDINKARLFIGTASLCLLWFMLLNEGEFYHLGFEQTTTNYNSDLGAYFCVLGLNITQTDADFQTRRHSTRSHVTDNLACGVSQLVLVTRYTTVDEFETDEFANSYIVEHDELNDIEPMPGDDEVFDGFGGDYDDMGED